MAQNLSAYFTNTKPWLWIGAGGVSCALLILVILQMDIDQSAAMLKNISWPLVAAAFLFLILEGIATALRLWLFAQQRPCLSDALKANAIYVLLLVILPARLGEVAAILVLKHHLQQKYGAAAMSIIAQRLYDIMILGAVFLIALLGLGDFIDRTMMAVLAAGLIGFSFAVLMRLDLFLTLAALMFRKTPKTLYRFILQARSYSRHNMMARDVPLALILTTLKWASNLSALVFLYMALHLQLDWFENVTVAAAYNFLAIIPLQTIGGIGVGEAGLALLLVGMGLPAGIAAGASLIVRFVILTFPFMFWVMVMGGLKIKERLGM